MTPIFLIYVLKYNYQKFLLLFTEMNTTSITIKKSQEFLGYGQKLVSSSPWYGHFNLSMETCESLETFTSPIDQYFVTDGKYIQGVNAGYSNVIMIKFIKVKNPSDADEKA